MNVCFVNVQTSKRLFLSEADVWFIRTRSCSYLGQKMEFKRSHPMAKSNWSTLEIQVVILCRHCLRTFWDVLFHEFVKHIKDSQLIKRVNYIICVISTSCFLSQVFITTYFVSAMAKSGRHMLYNVCVFHHCKAAKIVDE